MEDLIYRGKTMEAFREALCIHEDGEYTFLHVECILREQPSVDAEPVRHGRWVEHYKRPCSTMFDCSLCGGIAYSAQKNKSQQKSCMYRYCPNCGAKMDLEESE